MHHGWERGDRISRSDQGPSTYWLDSILLDALARNATAVHIEPQKDEIQVRLRLEGLLQRVGTLPGDAYNSLLEEIRSLALRVAGTSELPFSYCLRLVWKSRKTSIVITSVPTYWGARIALEFIPDEPPIELDLARLGLENNELKELREAIRQPRGLVIITGPEKSGKTTTVYSALMELNKSRISIATVERFCLRELPGIQQTVLDEKKGLDPDAAIRAVLRSDADVVFIQEFGEAGSVDLVVEGALSNKLVLAELSLGDAAGVPARFAKVNIEPWRICSAVLLVNAQRLLRRLCSECRKELPVNAKALVEAGLNQDQIPAAHIYRPLGCEACDYTGYRGKVLVCETMPFTADLKAAYSAGAPSGELKKIAVRGGMSTLRMSGLGKMLAGLTTLDEVLLNTPSDRP